MKTSTLFTMMVFAIGANKAATQDENSTKTNNLRVSNQDHSAAVSKFLLDEIPRQAIPRDLENGRAGDRKLLSQTFDWPLGLYTTFPNAVITPSGINQFSTTYNGAVDLLSPALAGLLGNIVFSGSAGCQASNDGVGSFVTRTLTTDQIPDNAYYLFETTVDATATQNSACSGSIQTDFALEVASGTSQKSSISTATAPCKSPLTILNFGFADVDNVKLQVCKYFDRTVGSITYAAEASGSNCDLYTAKFSPVTVTTITPPSLVSQFPLPVFPECSYVAAGSTVLVTFVTQGYLYAYTATLDVTNPLGDKSALTSNCLAGTQCTTSTSVTVSIDGTYTVTLTFVDTLGCTGTITQLCIVANSPSQVPSRKPSQVPSHHPSRSSKPSWNPSQKPSHHPSRSSKPSRKPSQKPSRKPSQSPTLNTKITKAPKDAPSFRPSHKPSTSAQNKMTKAPAKAPAKAPGKKV